MIFFKNTFNFEALIVIEVVFIITDESLFC